MGVGLDNIPSVTCFVIVKCSGFLLPLYLCEASVDIAKNFTLHVRERCLPKDVYFCYVATALAMTSSQAKPKLPELEPLSSLSHRVTFENFSHPSSLLLTCSCPASS